MDDLSSFSTENLKLSKITANYDHVKYIWNIFEALDNFLVQETRNFFKEKSPCNTRQIMSSLIINCKEKNTFWAYEVNKMLETIFGISREEALVYYSKLVHSQSSHSALQSSSLLSSYSTCDQLFPSHSGHINDQPYQIKNIYHASYLEKSRDTSVSDSIIKNPIHDNEATTEKADDKGVNFIDSTNDLRNTVMESSSSFQSFNSKFYSTKNHQAVFDILIKVLAASLVGHGYDARMSALLDTIIRQWLDDHHVVMDQIESSLIQQITQTCGIDGEDDVGGATTQKHMEAQHLSATTSKRNMLVGVGAVVGGVALGMSAGFAVPVLMPMIAALFGATSSASAVIGISSLFGVLFGAGGAGFTGYRVHSRYRDVKEFKFNRICVNSRIRVFLGVSGWITCDEDITNPWEFVTFRDTYALEVEKQAFMDLGTAIRDFLMSTAVSSFTISVLKTTALATAVGAIVWPMAVIQTGLIIDNRKSNNFPEQKKFDKFSS